MIELLKIYSKKFLKDILYINLCSLSLVFLTAYVNPKIDRNEVALTYFFTLNAILFLFSYPMEECLKWVLVTPIKKYKIIIFNILFQFYKIALTFAFLWINLLFFELPQTLKAKKSAFQEDYFFSTALENILDSRFFFGLIIFLFFIIVTIFSPSPKLILAQPGILKLKWVDFVYYFKKYKFVVLFLILLLPGVKFFKNYWNSPIIIYSLGFTYFIFNFFHSYFKKLKYPFLKRKSYYCIIILIFTLCFLTLKKYSNHRLQIKDLSSEHLASEILFQRSFYRGDVLDKMNRILKGDLDFSNFKKLRNYLKEEQKVKTSLIINKLKKLSLKNFLKEKDDPLWAFYLYKKKVFSFEEEKQFKSLQHFFFLKMEGHPFQYNFIKKFATMTSHHYKSPKDLDNHLKSRNKNEVLYSFHIIKLKNNIVFKDYFQKNLPVFENFIKIKDSKTVIH